jgi:predicted metalloprotease with PDZ domain
MTLRACAGARDRGGKPPAGAIDRCTLGMRIGADMKLAVVLRDGPAMRAGLSAGDVLVAIDGMKASTESLAALITRGVPGTTVTVHAFRRDELIEVSTTLDAAALDTCMLTLAAAPSAAALARRKAWLGV